MVRRRWESQYSSLDEAWRWLVQSRNPIGRHKQRLAARALRTALGRFTDLAITEARTAEALCCVAVRPGDLMVQDRRYARERNFAHARANGADFLTRIGWCSVKLMYQHAEKSSCKYNRAC